MINVLGPRSLSAQRIWLARTIAVAADLLQVAVFPAFMEGFLSPLNDVLDVVVAVSLIVIVGWHVAFIPTFIIEQLPFADLAPTWTIAVWLATRGKQAGADAFADEKPPMTEPPAR